MKKIRLRDAIILCLSGIVTTSGHLKADSLWKRRDPQLAGVTGMVPVLNSAPFDRTRRRFHVDRSTTGALEPRMRDAIQVAVGLLRFLAYGVLVSAVVTFERRPHPTPPLAGRDEFGEIATALGAVSRGRELGHATRHGRASLHTNYPVLRPNFAARRTPLVRLVPVARCLASVRRYPAN